MQILKDLITRNKPVFFLAGITALIFVGIIVLAQMNQSTGPSLIQLPDGDALLPTTPVLGSDNAPVTLTVFSDFECPGCKAYHPLLKKLYEDNQPKIRLAFRHFPLPQHTLAKPAAIAAQTALSFGKFWEYADILFNNQPEFSNDKLIEYAVSLGIDKDEFAKRLSEPRFAQEVDNDFALGMKLNIPATPSIFINNRFVEPKDIEAELAKEFATLSADSQIKQSTESVANDSGTTNDKVEATTTSSETKVNAETNSETTADSSVPADSTNEIRFTNEGFSPKNIKITLGDKVRWINDTDSPMILRQRMATYPELVTPVTINSRESFEFVFYKDKLWTFIEDGSQSTGSIFVMEPVKPAQ